MFCSCCCYILNNIYGKFPPTISYRDRQFFWEIFTWLYLQGERQSLNDLKMFSRNLKRIENSMSPWKFIGVLIFAGIWVVLLFWHTIVLFWNTVQFFWILCYIFYMFNVFFFPVFKKAIEVPSLSNHFSGPIHCFDTMKHLLWKISIRSVFEKWFS